MNHRVDVLEPVFLETIARRCDRSVETVREVMEQLQLLGYEVRTRGAVELPAKLPPVGLSGREILGDK